MYIFLSSVGFLCTLLTNLVFVFYCITVGKKLDYIVVIKTFSSSSFSFSSSSLPSPPSPSPESSEKAVEASLGVTGSILVGRPVSCRLLGDVQHNTFQRPFHR